MVEIVHPKHSRDQLDEWLAGDSEDGERWQALRSMLVGDSAEQIHENSDIFEVQVGLDELRRIEHLLERVLDYADSMADRDWLTECALNMSLCPFHLRDYAICFDDDDPECAPIRHIHPGHDT